MRNKFVVTIAAALMAASCFALVGCGGSSSSAQYKDGEYTAVGTGGKAGDVEVKVTVSGGKVTAIEPGENKETPEMFEKALNGIVPQVIEKQTADVESVSGASFSSAALKDGIAKALEQAK